MTAGVARTCAAALALALAGCGGGGGGAGEGAGGAATETGGGAAAPAGGEEIRIAMVAPLTGVYSPIGSGNVAGARVAVREINENGGIDGRRLVLDVLDDGSEPSKAVIHTQKIAGDERYPAMIGSGFGSAAVPSHEIASKAKMPYVSQSAAAAQVFPPKPYVYVTPPTSRLMALTLGRYLKDSGLEKVALLHDPSAYPTEGIGFVKEFQEQFGLEIVEDITFPLDASSFVSELTRIKNSDADAIWLWSVTPLAVTITKEYKQLRLPQKLILTGGNATPLYLEPACPDGDGAILNALLGPIYEHLPESVPTKAVAAKVNEAMDGKADQFSFDGYTGVTLLADVIREVGTDREAINEALESRSFVGPNGTYEYGPDDHAGLSDDDVAIVEIADCALEPVEGEDLSAKGRVP